MKSIWLGLALCAAAPTAVAAQVVQAPMPTIAGTRLEVSATGEATRVPDLAIVSAGVVTRQTTATAAIQENAARMERVLSALKRAGIEERDVQTSTINLNPEYRYQENRAPQLVGYTASNQVSIRFHDIRNTGKILDALVAEGANQINGPTLTIDKPEAALDEARLKALANGRARADVYARALGRRVARIVSISESGGGNPVPPPMPMMMEARAQNADSKILPGEQKLQVALSIVFDLQ
ncbi:MAG TPA: SIMPL domain-containing protein [Sphingomicrobium sp.]|nr:SIMPL domain-containing protein [Sphingomicrobium sp.]